jgi:nitrogen fixation protein FixH
MTDTAAVPSRGLQWPAFVLGLMALNLGVIASGIYFASRDGPIPVEPDYYQKAVDWDIEVQQQRVNARLAWTLKPEVVIDGGAVRIHVLLSDAAAAPVTDATLTAVAFHQAHSVQRAKLSFAHLGGGAYECTLRDPLPGRWEFRFEARQNKTTFTQKSEIEVGTAR